MSTYRISFDFDPSTKKVTGVTVTDSNGKEKAKQTKKSAGGSKSTALVKLDGNSLKLGTEVLKVLKADVGTKLSATLLSKNIIQIENSEIKGDEDGIAVTKTKTLNIRKIVSKNEIPDVYTYTVIEDGVIHLIGKEDEDNNVDMPVDDDIEGDVDKLVEEDLGDDIEEFDFSFDI